MKRFAVLGAGLFLLGGCALPVPFQVASWAIDGISYLMTEKSVTDHGISVLSQKDCAILRGLLDPGEFCRDFDDSATALAKGMPYDGLFSDSETISDEVDAITNFETASGKDAGVSVAAFDETDFYAEAGVKFDKPKQSALGDFNDISDISAPEVAEKAVEPKDWAARTTRNLETGLEPASGYYFVIGSFHDRANARDLRHQFRFLKPSVLAAKLDGATVFRVVVGPFGKTDEKNVHQEIFEAGIADSWAIQVKPGDWRMAMIDPPAVAPVEVAQVEHPEDVREWSAMDYTQMLSRLVY